MKKALIFVSMVAMLAGLTGCNGAKSEKAIKEDIQTSYDFFVENTDLEIKDIEITERKTDSKNQTDEVNCTISAENSEFKYTAEFVLKYHLYDQGWMMEELTQNSYEVIPLVTSITSDMAYGMLDKAFMIDIWDFAFYVKDDFIFDEEIVDLEKGLHEFYFKSNDGKKKLCVKYTFTKDGNNCDWIHSETTKVD